MKDIVSFGDGRKDLVVIPGLSVKNITDSAPTLPGIFKRFTKDYRVHVIDRPEDIGEGTTNADLAEAYYARMAGLGIQRADIIGISQGGMIAQHISVRHPEIVHKLVLGVTLAHGNPTSDATLERWLRCAESGDWNGLNRDIYDNLFTPAFIGRHKEAFEKLITTVKPDNPERFVRLIRAAQSAGPYEELYKITCPSLVIAAGRDSVLGVEGSRELAAAIGAELYIFDNYGHGVYDETPEFYAKAGEFLMKND